MKATQVKAALRKFADPVKRDFLPYFFKTGPGQYAEGDLFLGVTTPLQRIIARKYFELDSVEIEKLLKSKYHEERSTALLILVQQYQKGDEKRKEKIAALYQKNLSFVNNWDLVDLSAHKILGPHFEDRSRRQLYKWARSTSLWERRVAIMTTFHFLKKGDFKDTFEIGRILLADQEDLIHKAVGWMLREIGKIDLAAEERFLKRYYRKMPRTMLRYAIEKFPEKKRQGYLKGRV